MFDQRFFASKVGLSALVSIAAMIAFNFYALSQSSIAPFDQEVAALSLVELA